MRKHLFFTTAVVSLSAVSVAPVRSAQAPRAAYPARTAYAANASDTQPSATLQKGLVAYHPPAEWELAPASSNDTQAAYVDTKGPGILALQVLPSNAAVDKAAGIALVRNLKDGHKKQHDVMVMEPTIETDARFTLRIHEKYKHDGRLADELHLYRLLKGRGFMLTVNAASDKAEEVTPIFKTGEDVLLSVTIKPKK